MMPEDREKAEEHISLRRIWLKAVGECRRAIAQRSLPDASWDKYEADIGDRAVIDAVHALYYSLVDYGEASIRSDVDQYYGEVYIPKVRELKEANMDFHEKHYLIAKEAVRLYNYIMLTLNKYGMLFGEQPQGYSNVKMQSI